MAFACQFMFTIALANLLITIFFFFSSRRRHTSYWRDWSSDVCSSDLESMQAAILSLEKRGHPFSGTTATRLDWAEGLDVQHISAEQDAEVLLWVGCGGARVERNQRVIRAIARLLAIAGVKFAIMGREEKCSGDPARRIGNEFLFETLAQEHIATLDRYQVKTIVTSCPHCFNTFRNEYPQFGGRYEVFHHSQYL